AFDELLAVHVGQAEVEYHQARFERRERFQPGARQPLLDDLVAVRLEADAQELADLVLVLDDEDAARLLAHDAAPLSGRTTGSVIVMQVPMPSGPSPARTSPP